MLIVSGFGRMSPGSALAPHRRARAAGSRLLAGTLLGAIALATLVDLFGVASHAQTVTASNANSLANTNTNTNSNSNSNSNSKVAGSGTGGGTSTATGAGAPLGNHLATSSTSEPLPGDSTKRIPLFARGNEGDRPGLYITVSASLTDGTTTVASVPKTIIVDTGSSELNLPITFFDFPGGVLPARFGPPVRLISFTGSSLWGVRAQQATVTLGAGDSGSLVIRNAPVNIVTQRCIGQRCTSGDVGFGIIGINYQDAPAGSNVLRWAESPFNRGFLITTHTNDLASAANTSLAETTPVGYLHLGNFKRESFQTVQMVKRGVVSRSLPNGSPETIWDSRLPGACLTIDQRTYGVATATQGPVPIFGPASASSCQSEVVTDSGGRGGLIHFPGPLPAFVRPRGNDLLTVFVPGRFVFNFPVRPQPFAIRAFMNARNPNLSVNTGYRFFNIYDVFYDPIQGVQGFRSKGME